MRTVAFNPATGDYTGVTRVVDPKINLQLDRGMRAPRTDEYSIGVDRAIGRQFAVAVAYVGKRGSNFIGWTDVAGRYRQDTRTLADGRVLPVLVLDTSVTSPADRRFRLTNPEGYSLTYNGLVAVIEKRRSHGWQAFGSYTLSKTYGLQPSSGTSAAGAQTSTVSPPQPLTFGRDPNDLTNARGRLPNDRPHMLRAMGSVDVPRTGLVIAANLQYFSGKPWAAATQLTLPQGEQRILLEPRGSRRLSSQTLLDLRVSRGIRVGGRARIELLLDVLNALNERAEESLATETLMTDTLISPTFGRPASFVDPRRAMFFVTLFDIRAAAERVKSVARVTPLVDDALDHVSRARGYCRASRTAFKSRPPQRALRESMNGNSRNRRLSTAKAERHAVGRTTTAPAFVPSAGDQMAPPWAFSTRRATARLRPQPPRHSSNVASVSSRAEVSGSMCPASPNAIHVAGRPL